MDAGYKLDSISWQTYGEQGEEVAWHQKNSRMQREADADNQQANAAEGATLDHHHSTDT